MTHQEGTYEPGGADEIEAARDALHEGGAGARYVVANGIRTWVDERGEGEAVLLLHGGSSSTEDFDESLFALADRFRVVAYDRRANGRTADHGDFGRADLVADAASLIELLGLAPAHVVGFSDGGIIAAELATARPELVRSLVLSSASPVAEGWVDAALPHEPDEDDPLAGVPAELLEIYARLSPDGLEHYPIAAAKQARLTTEKGTDAATLAAFEGRALVLAADDDFVTLEGQLELYRAFSRGQLAVVPGASHAVLFEQPDVYTAIVRRFLEGGDPETYIPVRRATG